MPLTIRTTQQEEDITHAGGEGANPVPQVQNNALRFLLRAMPRAGEVSSASSFLSSLNRSLAPFSLLGGGTPSPMSSRRYDAAADQYVPPPYLRNLRALTIHDEEYQRISYLLRASLASLTVKVLSIHSINSPQQDALFEANHVGTAVVDSWVNGVDLPEENSVHNMVHHGGRFRIMDANKGAIFSTGVIGLEPGEVPPGPQSYEFVLMRVAAGRSFVVDPSQIGQHGIPAGYDSIAIHKLAEQDPAKYLREYIVNDESRIYPLCIVHFIFDAAADRIKAVPNCEACDSRPAVLYCMQDNAKLCEVCDREMHSRSRIYEKHNRVLLNEMQTSVGLTMCKDHPTMPVQFFNPVAHIPVCIHCKMQGSHSTGELANHQLVPIQDAYQASMDDLERERQIVEERRKTIRAQLTSIDRRMAQVNLNHEKCQDHIYEIVQRAVQVLHEETQSKLSALLSDEVELQRQIEYYAWMEAFLNYQKSCINPVEFLQTFKSHSSLLAQAPSEIVDAGANVKPDIRVVGRIEIVVDDSIAVTMAPPVPSTGVSPPVAGAGGVPAPSALKPSSSFGGSSAAPRGVAQPMMVPNYGMSRPTSQGAGALGTSRSNAAPRFAGGTGPRPTNPVPMSGTLTGSGRPLAGGGAAPRNLYD